MKAYNLHEIMSNAWAMYRKWAAPTSTITAVSPAATLLQVSQAGLGRCKDRRQKVAAGIVRMHYSQYKAEYKKVPDRRGQLRQGYQDHRGHDQGYPQL